MTEAFYVKAGMTTVDIKTKDTTTSSGTVGNYPDVTLDAFTYGLGVKGDLGGSLFYKVEGTYVDYDAFSATSTTSNKVTANLDGYNGKLAIGMKF